MPTLVNRTREVISSEVDDFFEDDTILFYLNKAKERVASSFVMIEEQTFGSLRVLDELREIESINTSGLDVVDKEGYFLMEVPFPLDMLQFNYLEYGQVPLRELKSQNISTLQYSNALQTDQEGYYNITKINGNKVFNVYLFKNVDDIISIHYIKNPASLFINSQELIDLPSRVENAVIYGAASLLIMQEGVRDPNITGSLETFRRTHSEELESNVF